MWRRHQQNGRFEEMECLGRNQRRDIMSKTEACCGFVDNHDPPRGSHRFQNPFLIQRRNGSRVDYLDRDPSLASLSATVGFMHHCRQRNDGDVLSFAGIVGYT